MAPNTFPRIITSCTMMGSINSILRLQTIVAVFLIKGLHCGRILHQCNNHISIVRSFLFLNEHIISIQNTGIHRAVTLYFQHETVLIVGHIFRRHREIVLHILHSQQRHTGSHRTEQRHVDHLAAHRIEIIINDLDSPGLRGISADLTVLLQRLQMMSETEEVDFR